MKTAEFSIIIPVLDEAATINEAIRHVTATAGDHAVEVLVVDGDPAGCTVRTIEGQTVKKLVAEKGRGCQMNRGASRAAGEVLLFLHADTMLPAGAFDCISSVLEDDAVVGGAFDLGIDAGGFAYRLIDRVASLRSRLTRLPYGDQALFIRRPYFIRLGGFTNIPIMEDVDLMQRIKREKGKIHIIRKRVSTSPRRWEKEGIVRGTLRNWFLITLYLFGMKPEKLTRYYHVL